MSDGVIGVGKKEILCMMMVIYFGWCATGLLLQSQIYRRREELHNHIHVVRLYIQQDERFIMCILLPFSIDLAPSPSPALSLYVHLSLSPSLSLFLSLVPSHLSSLANCFSRIIGRRTDGSLPDASRHRSQATKSMLPVSVVLSADPRSCQTQIVRREGCFGSLGPACMYKPS
jgi:hypothetical protein